MSDRTYSELLILHQLNSPGQATISRQAPTDAHMNIDNLAGGIITTFSDLIGDGSTSYTMSVGLSLADGQNETIYAGGHGIGFVSFVSPNAGYSDTQEWAIFTFAQPASGDIVVNTIHISTNVSTTYQTDNSFNIDGTGSSLRFENQLGADSGTEGEGFVFLLLNDLSEGS